MRRGGAATALGTAIHVLPRLFADDHSDAMAALGAMAAPKPKTNNVIRLKVGKLTAGPF